VEKFIIGLAAGMAGGALLVSNNCKLLNLVIAAARPRQFTL